MTRSTLTTTNPPNPPNQPSTTRNQDKNANTNQPRTTAHYLTGRNNQEVGENPPIGCDTGDPSSSSTKRPSNSNSPHHQHRPSLPEQFTNQHHISGQGQGNTAYTVARHPLEPEGIVKEDITSQQSNTATTGDTLGVSSHKEADPRNKHKKNDKAEDVDAGDKGDNSNSVQRGADRQDTVFKTAPKLHSAGGSRNFYNNHNTTSSTSKQSAAVDATAKQDPTCNPAKDSHAKQPSKANTMTRPPPLTRENKNQRRLQPNSKAKIPGLSRSNNIPTSHVTPATTSPQNPNLAGNEYIDNKTIANNIRPTPCDSTTSPVKLQQETNTTARPPRPTKKRENNTKRLQPTSATGRSASSEHTTPSQSERPNNPYARTSKPQKPTARHLRTLPHYFPRKKGTNGKVNYTEFNPPHQRRRYVGGRSANTSPNPPAIRREKTNHRTRDISNNRRIKGLDTNHRRRVSTGRERGERNNPPNARSEGTTTMDAYNFDNGKGRRKQQHPNQRSHRCRE
jgi:hypothetical protein